VKFPMVSCSKVPLSEALPVFVCVFFTAAAADLSCASLSAGCSTVDCLCIRVRNLHPASEFSPELDPLAEPSPELDLPAEPSRFEIADLMLPNDLDLDLMFGDGMEALLGGGDAAGMCGGLPAPADKPPIGLCLRKSQSLLDLINARLQKEASPASGAAAIAAVPEAEATASGAVPMQCA